MHVTVAVAKQQKGAIGLPPGPAAQMEAFMEIARSRWVSIAQRIQNIVQPELPPM